MTNICLLRNLLIFIRPLIFCYYFKVFILNCSRNQNRGKYELQQQNNSRIDILLLKQ